MPAPTGATDGPTGTGTRQDGRMANVFIWHISYPKATPSASQITRATKKERKKSKKKKLQLDARNAHGI